MRVFPERGSTHLGVEVTINRVYGDIGAIMKIMQLTDMSGSNKLAKGEAGSPLRKQLLVSMAWRSNNFVSPRRETFGAKFAML